MNDYACPFHFNTKSSQPLYQQLYWQIRQRILAGDWVVGQRLPSTRRLAQQCGVARVTVAQAYAQLQAEGFVTARRGAGTFVADLPAAAGADTAVPPIFSPWGQRLLAQPAAVPSRQPTARIEFDFGFGRSFPHIFPYDIWRLLLARYLSTDDVMLSRYGSVAGFMPLREALAAHLAQWRGVVADPAQIVIVNGAQQALDIVARLLLTVGDEVLVETPGYIDAYQLFRLHGARLTALPVDAAGFPVAQIAADSAARLVFVTPSNQFPRGGTMPVARRLALLRWAQAHNAFVIEDDYDGELRYDGRPLTALQSLDEYGRVIYLGTFSKVLFPALRLAYVVLPPPLVQPFIQAKAIVDRGAPTLTQAAVTDFISEGHFDQHLRRLRQAHGERRAALVQALGDFLPQATYVDEPAGLHVMLSLPQTIVEADFVQQAAAAGVGVYPGVGYHLAANPPPSVLLGFSGLAVDAIAEGVQRLGEVMAGLLS